MLKNFYNTNCSNIQCGEDSDKMFLYMYEKKDKGKISIIINVVQTVVD